LYSKIVGQVHHLPSNRLAGGAPALQFDITSYGSAAADLDVVSSTSAAAEPAENVQIRRARNYSRRNRIEPISAKAEMFERRRRCRSSKAVIARSTSFPKPCLCSRGGKVNTDALHPMFARLLGQAARISSIGPPWQSTPERLERNPVQADCATKRENHNHATDAVKHVADAIRSLLVRQTTEIRRADLGG
jgi:hypothetical protein